MGSSPSRAKSSEEDLTVDWGMFSEASLLPIDGTDVGNEAVLAKEHFAQGAHVIMAVRRPLCMMCLEEVSVLVGRRDEFKAQGYELTFVVKEAMLRGLKKLREHIGENAPLFLNQDMRLFKCHGQDKLTLGKLLTDKRTYQSGRRASQVGKLSPKKFKNELGGEGFVLGSTLALEAPTADAGEADFSQRLVYLKKETFVGDTTAADGANLLVRRVTVPKLELPPDLKISAAFNDRVAALVSASAIVLFTKTTCGYCDAAKEVFKELKKTFEECQLDKLQADEAAGLQAALQARTGIDTVPVIFVNGQLVGGFDALTAARDAGTLLFE